MAALTPEQQATYKRILAQAQSGGYAPTPSAPTTTPPKTDTQKGLDYVRSVNPTLATGIEKNVPQITQTTEQNTPLSTAIQSRAPSTQKSNRDVLLESLTSALEKSSSFNPTETRAQLEQKQNISQLTENVGSFEDEIAKTNQLLDSLESDIKTRTGGFLVNDAQRNRLLASERNPLITNLGVLERGYGTASDRLSRAQQAVQTGVSDAEAAANRPLDLLGTRTNLLSNILSATQPEQTDVRQVGNDIVQYNPSTGQYDVVYSGSGGSTSRDTQITEANSKRLLVDTQTGQVIADLGATGSGSSGVQLSADDRRVLLSGGFNEQEATQIENDVRQYGIAAATQGMSDTERSAVERAFGGSAAVTETPEPQFLSKDYFKSLYTTQQLEQAAADAGFGDLGKGIFNLKDVDTEKYLTYLDTLVNQYRSAGYTDKEILKLMQ